MAQLIKMTFFNDGSLRICRVVSPFLRNLFQRTTTNIGVEGTLLYQYIPFGLHIFVPYFCTIFNVKHE